jgi:replicative DNA helicase
MMPKALAMRAISEQTAVNNYALAYSEIRRGNFTERHGHEIKRAAEELSHLPITFLPREFQDAELLQAGVRQILRRGRGEKTPLVLVDYAQLMRSNAKSRYEQITDISLALKGLAMSLEVPLVALSQLSRAVEQREERRPRLSDLRESGQLEQDADGVIFCYRDEYYLQREEPDMEDMDKHDLWRRACEASRNKLELIVAKQRQGEIGTAHVMFNPAINRVWER